MVKLENKWLEAPRKLFNYFLRGKAHLCRWVQAHFYSPHLMLTFSRKSQGGKRTTAPPVAPERKGISIKGGKCRKRSIAEKMEKGGARNVRER